MPRTTRESRHAKRDAFLAAYAELGTLTHAARASGCDRGTHYAWMANDPDYPALFEAAAHQANDALEREARRRAVEGTEKPVYQGGKLVGTIREFSDTLLIFIMKGALPSKYRERVDVTVDIRSAIEKLTSDPAEREAAVAEAERILAKGR